VDGERDKRVSVVIVGAGPTGLTAANLLGMAGIETLLIERNEGICDFPRAIAIDDEGLRVCQAMGLADEVLAHIRFDVKAHYVSGGRFLARVEPTERRNGYPLISTFHQPALEGILLRGIERFSCVSVLFQHMLNAFEQDGKRVHISIHTPDGSLVQVECDYLLACDGGKSAIRRALDIAMRPPVEASLAGAVRPWNPSPQQVFLNLATEVGTSFSASAIYRPLPVEHEISIMKEEEAINRGRAEAGPYTGDSKSVGKRGWLRARRIKPNRRTAHARRASTGQKWLVVDCISDREPSDTIIFFCNPGRPAVSVPGPGLQRRWEFMLLPGEQEEDLLRDDVIHVLIRRARRSMPRGHYATGTQLIPMFQIIRKAIYTFHALTATSLAKGRVFLLGDAAHLMPPFGGQGMNSGLRDAHNLCWKLQLVLQRQANPELLASYHVERHSHVAQMILFSWLLGKAIMPTGRLIAFLRDIFLRSVDKIPPVREAIKEMRVKPQPRYKHGFLLACKGEGKELVGTMLPQPYVLTRQGKRVLLDDALGNGFALLRLYEDPRVAFEGLRHEVWDRLGVRFVCVGTRFIASADLSSFPSYLNNTATRVDQLHDRCIYIIDSEQQLATFLQYRRDLYVLVRPDRYVMGVFRIEQADKFTKALENTLTQFSGQN